MSLFTRALLSLTLLGSVSFPSAAQQAITPDAHTPSPQNEGPNKLQDQDPAPKTSEEILQEAEKQRMLGVVPMFGMTNYKDAPPLTSSQKFRLMAKTTLDPFTWVAVGGQAGISQASNEFAGYGQGAAGYAKRYGATWTDSFDSNFFSNFLYPVLFKQDPRYFRVGEGSLKSRIASSLEQEVVTRKDSGGRTFSYSNVLGALTAGSISNVYYPPEDRGFGLTISRASIALGYGCLGNLFLEFWPDIDRKWFHKNESAAQPPEPPGTTPR